MYLKSISWSDKENLIADVTISDNKDEIVCFCHPCNKSIGEKIDDDLYCLNITNFTINDADEEIIIKNNEYYSYLLKGILVNNKKIKINGFKINLDDYDLPKDINVGNYIKFDVARIDLY